MRRPAAVFPAVFGTGIFASYSFCSEVLFWLPVFTFAVAFFIYMILKKYDKKSLGICLAICFFAAGGLRLAGTEAVFSAAGEQCGSKHQLTGTVINAEEKNGKHRFIIRENRIGILVTYYGQEDDIDKYPGCRVKITGKVYMPQQRRNPGCFDYSLYLKSCGICSVMSAEKIEIQDRNSVPVIRFSAQVRNYFDEILAGNVSEETKGFLMAMTFGEKSGMDEELIEEFRGTGTAHILAVSGLHTGIVYAAFAQIFRRKKGTVFYLSSLVMLTVYTVAAGFSPSVVRAAMMIGIHSIAELLYRRYDLLSAAGTVFFVMLADNPFRLFSTGFQLSFLAVASLAVLLPYINGFYKGIFLVPLSVQLGTVPYTSYVFNSLAVMSLAANVPAVIIAGVLLPAVLCMPLASIVSDTTEELFACFLEAGYKCMAFVNQLFYADGRSCFDVIGPPVWVLSLYYGIVFMLVSEMGLLMRLRKQYKRIAAMAAVIVMSSVVLNISFAGEFGKADVIFVDVGQGDCIHVKTDEGKNYLIDGGGSTGYDTGSEVLKPYLLKNGVKHIDAAFVTHLHEDHYGGIRSLASEGMIESIGVYEANRLIEERVQSETNTELFYLHGGQKIRLGRDVYLEVLAPSEKSEEEYSKIVSEEDDENAASLVFRLDYRGIRILITGDIDSAGEEVLTEMYGNRLKSDILKVPHHGSRYSSSEDFIAAVSPDVAVFQVGRNNYGHPDAEILRRYINAGVSVYRNDRNGAVGLDIKRDGKTEVMTMLD